MAGGAYGIDAAAHRAALASGGQTVAVMVGGLDRLYPPGATPTKRRFLARNHILGALSGATIVVEAGYPSGSLNVAARAAQLGRPVGAVPGPVTSASSAGTHRLLRKGIASLVTRVQDVTALLDGSPETSRSTIERGVGLGRPARPEASVRSF